MSRLNKSRQRLLRTYVPGQFEYWGMAWLIALLYSILCFVTPYFRDDWIFIDKWMDDINGGQDFSFSKLWDFFVFIRGYDNGRIANILSPISTIFSPIKDIFPVLTGIIIALTAVLVQKAVCKNKSSFLLAVTWALMIIGLPWKNYLFTRDFSLNYIWAAFFTILFLITVRQGTRQKWPWSIFLTSIILAIIAGGWHEGFAYPTACGLGLMILVRKFRFSIKFYVVFIIYIIAATLFFVCPGMISRTQNEVNGSLVFPTMAIVIIQIALCVFIVICLCLKQGRKILSKAIHSDIVIVCVGIIISGLLLAMVAKGAPRSYYWPNLAAIAILVYLINKWLKYLIGKNTKIFNPVLITLSGLLVIGCAIQTIGVIIWQSRYTEDWNNIISLLEDSESGTVYYDFPYPGRSPKYTLSIPMDNLWTSPWDTEIHLRSFIHKPMLGVVPTKLRNASLENGISIEGNIELKMYNTFLISRYEKFSDKHLTITPEYRAIQYVTPEGENKEGIFIAIPFLTEKGDTLLYYRSE